MAGCYFVLCVCVCTCMCIIYTLHVQMYMYTCTCYGEEGQHVTSCDYHVTTLTAIAIAMEDSVTVSMGLLTNGVFRVSFFVKAEVRS